MRAEPQDPWNTSLQPAKWATAYSSSVTCTVCAMAGFARLNFMMVATMQLCLKSANALHGYAAGCAAVAMPRRTDALNFGAMPLVRIEKGLARTKGIAWNLSGCCRRGIATAAHQQA